MFSSISYYAVLANLLYTFNLVNNPKLDAIKNQLYPFYDDRKIQNMSIVGLNLEHSPDLINSKVEHKLVKLQSSKPNQLPQISKYDLPSNSIAQILLLTIVVYFVSIQVYHAWHRSSWKQCFIPLGFSLTFILEYYEYLGLLKPAFDWKIQPTYHFDLQYYDLLFISSITLNIIFLTCLIFSKSKKTSFVNKNGLTRTHNHTSLHRSVNSSNNIYFPMEQKRNVYSLYNNLLMSRFIGTPQDLIDNINFEEDRISVVSSTISEHSSFYNSSSMAPMSTQSRLQMYQLWLRASCTSPTRSSALNPISDSVSEVDSFDNQLDEKPPNSDVD